MKKISFVLLALLGSRWPAKGNASIAFVLLALLGSCSSLEDTFGLQEDDNGILCLRGASGGGAAFLSGDITGVRIEFPAAFDSSQLTPEQIAQLLTLCK